jgi:RHS repeat-associated protein
VTRHAYDGLNRLVETTRQMTTTGTGEGAAAATIVTRQSWDDSHRLLTRTDPNGNVTTYGYDSLSRLIEERPADGTAVVVAYDVHHRQVAVVDANGTRQDMVYDDLGRLAERNVTPGVGVLPDTTFERFRYDGLSRVVGGENDFSVLGLVFDSRSALVRETLNGRTTACVYDGVGNLVSCEYPGGRRITAGYDALDRRRQIQDEAGLIADYRYVGAGRVHRRDYGNGTRLSLEYDGIAGRPNPTGDLGVKQLIRGTHSVSETGALLDDRAYTFDAAYNTASQRDLRTGGLSEVYRYDSLNRLVTSERSAGVGPADTIAYTFDPAGNRLSVVGGPDAGSYVLDPTVPAPADRPVHQYTATPFDTREYDLQGNLTRASATAVDGRRLGYDFRNRLVAVTNLATGVVVNYGYDVLGRRIQRTVQGAEPTATHYFYRGHQEIEETDADGNVLATYVYGNYVDEVLTMRRGGADYYFHADRLYSVRALTDAAGAVIERYQYGDYGQPTVLTASGTPRSASAVGNELMFTGRRYDAETGLYYYRTRFLDPRAGRFISRDTIGVWTDRLNLGNGLSYVGNNPVSRLDPFGLTGLGVVGVEAAAAVGEAAAAWGSGAGAASSAGGGWAGVGSAWAGAGSAATTGAGTAGAGAGAAAGTGAGAGAAGAAAGVGAAAAGAAIAVGAVVGAAAGMAFMELTGRAPFEDEVNWWLDQLNGENDDTIPDGEPVTEPDGEPVPDEPPAPAPEPNEEPAPAPAPGPGAQPGAEPENDGGNGCPGPYRGVGVGGNAQSAIAGVRRQLQENAPPGCTVRCRAVSRPKSCGGGLFEVTVECTYVRNPAP